MNEAQIIVSCIVVFFSLLFGFFTGLAAESKEGDTIGPIFILIVLVVILIGGWNLFFLLSKNF